MTTVFAPLDFHRLTLPNRNLMSRMTRNRAAKDGVPTDTLLFNGLDPKGYTDYPALP